MQVSCSYGPLLEGVVGRIVLVLGLPRWNRELVPDSERPSTETTDRRPTVYCAMYHCPKTKMVLLSLDLPMRPRPRDVRLVREMNLDVGLFGRRAV